MPAALGEAVSADRSHWQSLIDRWAGTGGTRWKVGSWGVMGSLAALGALTLGGLAIQLAGPERVVALYVLAYAGAVCLTPWPFQLRRYWSPLAPLLALALFQCVLALRGRGRFAGSFVVRIAARTLPVIVVVIVLTVQVFTLFYAYRVIRGNVVLHDRQGAPIRFSLFFYRQPDRDLDEVLEWLRVRARPGDVVAAAMPHWAHLVTGMKTVVPPFETDPERAQALLDSVPVRYIVMDPDGIRLMRESAAAVLDSHSARWRRVYTGASGLASVYERVCETASGAR
jgi:PAS domain-containing protein